MVVEGYKRGLKGGNAVKDEKGMEE